MGGSVEQDPEKITWIAGAIATAIVTAAGVIRGARVKFFAGPKVDQLSDKMDANFKSLNDELHSFFREDVKIKTELLTRMDEHDRRLDRLEDGR